MTKQARHECHLGIAYLARPIFDPPSSYIVPLSFVVAPPSYFSALTFFFVAVQAVFVAPPSFIIALPLEYVVVEAHSLWS